MEHYLTAYDRETDEFISFSVTAQVPPDLSEKIAP